LTSLGRRLTAIIASVYKGAWQVTIHLLLIVTALGKKQSTGPEPIELSKQRLAEEIFRFVQGSLEGIFITSSIIMTHDSSAFHKKGEGQIPVSCYLLSAEKSCPPRVPFQSSNIFVGQIWGRHS